MMTCGFCGRTFQEDRGQSTCQRCPLARACKAIRCPHCGYENPLAPVLPGWLSRLRSLATTRVSR